MEVHMQKKGLAHNSPHIQYVEAPGLREVKGGVPGKNVSLTRAKKKGNYGDRTHDLLHPKQESYH